MRIHNDTMLFRDELDEIEQVTFAAISVCISICLPTYPPTYLSIDTIGCS